MRVFFETRISSVYLRGDLLAHVQFTKRFSLMACQRGS